MITPRKYSCPTCGAAVEFFSSLSVYNTCVHCGTMIVLHDQSLESIGLAAKVPPDLSALQVGSRGKWNGRTFYVAGRIRQSWAKGSWNEWYLIFDEGSPGWLAEAQGEWILFLSMPLVSGLDSSEGMKLSKVIKLEDGREFIVADRKQIVCIASEGELPFASPKGNKSLHIDLHSSKGEIATWEQHDKESPIMFLGNYASFDELNFTNLRDWEFAEASVKGRSQFSCPSCGGQVKVEAVGLTVHVGCIHCKAVIRTQNENYEVVTKSNRAIKTINPVLPFGKTGKLKGEDWKIVGMMKRRNLKWGFDWDEYLLFNHRLGFSWLVHSDGHWNIVKVIRKLPELVLVNSFAKLENKTFPSFSNGNIEVTGVLGEFYWEVEAGDRVKFVDYVYENEMLSCEESEGEFTWSLGEYVNPNVVEKAFGVANLGLRKGIAPNQTFLPNFPLKFMVGSSIVAMVLLFVVQIFSVSKSKNILILEKEVSYPDTGLVHEYVSPAFRLELNNANLMYQLTTSLANSWMYQEVELVNEADGSSSFFALEASLYSGVDGGERWSEGSNRNTAIMNSVLPGLYHIEINSMRPNLDRQTWSFVLRSDVPIWINFLLVGIVISLLPSVLLILKATFQHKKWKDSDFGND